MGVVQLPDELQGVIERQVAQGRASSPLAFLEDAVMRLVEESAAEEDEILRSAEAGLADIAAGRFTTISTSYDQQQLHTRLMDRLKAPLAADG